MIGKKVVNKKSKDHSRSASHKKQRIINLVTYMFNPEGKNKNEKCTYGGGYGFVTEGLKSSMAEMIALATDAVRSNDPVNHYVLSWREGEKPTATQVDEAVNIFLNELNLTGHQIFYALHADTDNYHLHLAVNRVHPDTGKPVEINKGFDIEAVHKAVARIEHAQGWQREKHGRYQFLENGELGREHLKSGKSQDQEEPRKPTQRRRDMEIRTGEKSIERIAIEEAAPIIKQAKTWQELHSGLSEKGMRYERTGSGAMIYVGDIAVKASNVDRNASLPKLQKRLGIYEPPQEKPNVYLEHTIDRTESATEEEPDSFNIDNLSENGLRKLSECGLARNPENKTTPRVLSLDARAYRRRIDPVRREPGSIYRDNGDGTGRRSEPLNSLPELDLDWDTYITGRNAHYADKKQAYEELKKKHDEERNQLSSEQKKQRDEVFNAVEWKGKGLLLCAMSSAIAGRQDSQKTELKYRQKKEREQLRSRFGQYPDFETWLRNNVKIQHAEMWRYRVSIIGCLRLSGGDSGDKNKKTYEPSKIIQDKAGNGVYVWSKYDAPAFIDNGDTISVLSNNDTAIIEALKLSQAKWGDNIEVEGSESFRRQAWRLGTLMGLKIEGYKPTLDELRELQAKLQEQEQAEMGQAMRIESTKSGDRKQSGQLPIPQPVPPVQLDQFIQFKKYHEAVNADRYRVTCIHMFDTKKTFILDKRNGETKGFTTEEIEKRTQEMQRLQSRGENIYYTPLSTGKHHILIDDMNRLKLEKLISDGYKPAVVIESSPGNYQAVITIPKLGTAHDKDVGNRLVECINKEYGDPKLSGCIHPHRAPGYQNRKPKHQREDGSYPEVKLLKAERRECAKTFTLSIQIDAEYQRLANEGPQHREHTPRAAVDVAVATGSTLDACQRHSQDVLQRQRGGQIDFSRVDAMVAVRMRVTGHSQADIEAALRQSAPALRENPESHNWDDYSRRTAAYAFSAKGDIEVKKYIKYKQQWLELEAQAPVEEPVFEHEGTQDKDDGPYFGP